MSAAQQQHTEAGAAPVREQQQGQVQGLGSAAAARSSPPSLSSPLSSSSASSVAPSVKRLREDDTGTAGTPPGGPPGTLLAGLSLCLAASVSLPEIRLTARVFAAKQTHRESRCGAWAGRSSQTCPRCYPSSTRGKFSRTCGRGLVGS